MAWTMLAISHYTGILDPATSSLRSQESMPPQLEKNHVVPTAWQDEALARDGVFRPEGRDGP